MIKTLTLYMFLSLGAAASSRFSNMKTIKLKHTVTTLHTGDFTFGKKRENSAQFVIDTGLSQTWVEESEYEDGKWQGLKETSINQAAKFYNITGGYVTDMFCIGDKDSETCKKKSGLEYFVASEVKGKPGMLDKSNDDEFKKGQIEGYLGLAPKSAIKGHKSLLE